MVSSQEGERGRFGVQGGRQVGGTLKVDGERDDVRRAVAGDPQAFERLYRSHVGRVYALAVRLVDEEWAEDLTQEVFIRAWDKLSTFGGRARFGTWLHRLAVNLILSRRGTLRNRERRKAGGDDVIGLAAAPKLASPLARLDLEAAVRRLPDRAREVFVLFDVEGYSHEEIAELTGVTVGTSKSQLHRARMMMREYLNR